MIGGGGAGNKDGLSGSGGFYSTTNGKILNTNSSYSLNIGSGGTSNGADGGVTSGFDLSVKGGYGGKAHTLENYEISFTTTSWVTYGYDQDGWVEDDGESYRNLDSRTQIDKGDTIYIECDQYGNQIAEYGIYHGAYIYVYRGINGFDWYHLDSGDWGEKTANFTSSSRPSDEKPSTTIFNTTITVGGPGSTSSVITGSRYGQGGGALGQYGASSFGAGKSGIIAIRNHR